MADGQDQAPDREPETNTGDASSSAERHPLQGRHLLLFALLLLIARGLFLLAALDPAQERVVEVLDPAGLTWTDGPERPLYDREELFTATAAEALRLDVGLPLAAGRYYVHSNGSLVITLMAVPVYALFGPHYLAFKIIPLLVTLVGGLAWFLVVWQWWGWRAAWVFGLLYVFAPSAFLRTALIAKGDHAEAMAIVGVALLLASRAAAAAQRASGTRWAAAGGVVVGLGVFMTYATLPVWIGAGAVALVITRLRPARIWMAFGIGLLMGLVPWGIAYLASSGASVQIYGRSLAQAGAAADVLERVGALFGMGFLAQYDLPGGAALPAIAGHLWVLAVAAGWVSVGLARGRASRWLLLGATAAHLAAFCLRAPHASPRYLMPAYPLLLIAVALLATRVGRIRPARGFPVVALVVALGVWGQAHAVLGSRFPALRAPLRGTDWRLLGEVAGKHVPPDQIGALPPSLQPYFWASIGKRAYAEVDPERWAEAAALAGEDARFVWEGLGIAWTEDLRGGMRMGEYLEGLPPADGATLVRGVARYAEVLLSPLSLARGLDGLKAYLDQFPPADQVPMRRAAARTLAILSLRGYETSLQGGQGMAGMAVRGERGQGLVAERILQGLLGEEEMAYGAGYALCRSVLGHAGAPRLWPRAPGAWPESWRDDLQKGAGSSALWTGVAAVFRRELSGLSAEHVLNGLVDGGWLVVHLHAWETQAPPAAEAFYRAAGQAAGRAWRDPSRLRSVSGDAPSDAEVLAAPLPPERRPAFLEGLRAALTFEFE